MPVTSFQMNVGIALNPVTIAAGGLSPLKPGTTPMIQLARMALEVAYPSLIPATVTLLKYVDGDSSAFSRYPLIVTGAPLPSSVAGSPVPTGAPLIEVTARPPRGSLPPATVDWLVTMLEMMSVGVTVVVWVLPSDPR